METSSDGQFSWVKVNVQYPECTIGRHKLFNRKLNLEEIKTEYKLLFDVKCELNICSSL